ncbi:helix-turn-helix transcriptional regulator [Cellulomonas telluris]|uniref:helix-turn-helix transcriptional regulator n=1 Tax=Cellulomonas telluris TaxID=2306636 RepID=UPI0010A7C052|nr:LuxR C-terminal-related transcriptional regulator [Cellulomonas telluris]
MSADDVRPRPERETPALHGAPRLPSWAVPRPRLVAALDRRAPLTVVRAPAGGGKTVLLAEWARASGDPALRGVWVSVTAPSPGRLAFWGQVAALVSDAGLGPPDGPLADGDGSLAEVVDLRAFLTRAFAGLGSATLVVDDADRLDDDVVEDLVHVVTAVPTVRLVVACRSVTAFESARVRLVLDSEVLDGAALALTPQETARVLGVPEPDAAAVHRATDGSPLAVRAVLLEREAGGDVDPRQALEQLVAAAVDALDAPVRAFAAATVTADVLPPDLARTLSGAQDADALLDHVARLGLGTWTHVRGERALAYTSVVRQALRARLRREDPARFRALRRAVAVWADAHGRPVEAVEAAVDADDLDLVTAVLRHHWRGFLSEHAGTVRRTVAPLGLVRLRRHPVILFLLALGHNADRRSRAVAVALFGLATATARAQRHRASAPDRVAMRLIETVALRVTGRAGAAAHAGDDLLALLEDLAPADRSEVEDLLNPAYLHTGLAYLYDGRPDDAAAAGERALAEARHDLGRLGALSLLAGLHALSGSLEAAEGYAADVRGRRWPEGSVDGYTGALHQVAEAVLALEALDPARAQAHLDRLAPHRETIEHWPLLAHVQAHVDLLTSGAETAIERLASTRRAHARRQSTHRATAALLDATHALLVTAAGRPLAAAAALPDARPGPALTIARARAELVAGRPAQAVASLAGSAVPGLPPRTQAEQALLEAAALAADGRQTQAVPALARALALLRVHRLRLPLVLLPAGHRARLRALAVARGLPDADLLAADVPAVLPDVAAAPELTPREAVVLRALTRSGSTSEIAAELVVSPHTVKSQLRTLYRKLGATSRASALASARAHGLLEADETVPGA